ncbi:MAG: 4-hydroxy-tetrahydrodipicolinate synthase [Bacteroidales bacterium]|nr:4-hydroxy-tetrahydrodipicolinate synthase [Bacteroidales bacterium]
MEPELTGLGVAMITPFNEDKSIDFQVLEKLLEHLIPNIDYLIVFGTTSEAPVLTAVEKNEIMAVVRKQVNGKIPIVMGLGGNNTQSLIAEMKTGDFAGVDAFLSVTPYYNKPNQRGLIAHYTELAKFSPRPLILYNVPGRTAVNIDAETALTLAENPNIIAVKEASGNLSQVMTILDNCPQDFKVVSGDDALTLPLMSMGATGVISVIGNAFPKEMQLLTKYMFAGKTDKAQEIHYRLLPFIETIFKDGNPAGIKALLSLMGIVKNELRLPLVPVTNEHFEEMRGML